MSPGFQTVNAKLYLTHISYQYLILINCSLNKTTYGHREEKSPIWPYCHLNSPCKYKVNQVCWRDPIINRHAIVSDEIRDSLLFVTTSYKPTVITVCGYHLADRI